MRLVLNFDPGRATSVSRQQFAHRETTPRPFESYCTLHGWMANQYFPLVLHLRHDS